MLNVKNTMIDRMLDFVAPHPCSGCGQIGTSFCGNCKYNINTEPFLGCILCEKPSLQGVCVDHKVGFNQAWVVGVRSGPLQRLIGGFKFKNMKAAASDLCDLLNSRLPPLPASSIFVPIPTTPAHIRERGYDHMLLITLLLGKRRHLPVQQVLVRDNTLTQHLVNRKERFKQVTSAFRVEGPIDPHKTYIIVDDVITTGATIQQAAMLLKEAGATTVWVAATSYQPLD